MSRRILTGRAPVAGAVGGAPLAAPTQDDYLGRLVKYIPAEIVGLYLAMRAAVPPGQKNYAAYWVIFGVNLALVPTYMWIVTSREEGKGPLWVQALLATIAFPVWALAIGEPFSHLSWYQGWIASLLLMFVTVVFGMFKPPQGA